MAKKVLSFFDGSSTGHGNAKYPWDRWADGNIWEVTAGVDFDCKPISFRGILYSYAKRSGLKLQVQSLTRMGKLRFRFYNPAVEELTLNQWSRFRRLRRKRRRCSRSLPWFTRALPVTSALTPSTTLPNSGTALTRPKGVVRRKAAAST